MPSTPDLLPILDAIYTGAADETQWARMLDAIGRAFQSTSVAVVTDASRVSSVRPAPTSASRVSVVPPSVDRGAALHVSIGTTTAAVLTIERRRECPGFSEDAIAFCGILVPHLERAFALRARLQSLEAHRAALFDALDRLPLGVLFLDADSRPLQMNESAHKLLAQGDGLGIVGGRLTASFRSEAATLRRLLGGCPPEGGALLVSRQSSERPLSLAVTPLPTPASRSFRIGPTIVVFVCDPDARLEPLSTLFATLYSLTPTEGLVATLLMQGRRVEEITRDLGVTLNTTRTHLKRIYSKTGAASQSGLVRLLVTGPAQLRLAGSTRQSAA